MARKARARASRRGKRNGSPATLKGAMDECRLQLAREPGSANAHHRMAGLAVRAGMNTLAITHFAKAVHLQPDDPTIRLALGDFMFRLGNFWEAEHSFKIAVALAPTAEMTLCKLGKTQRRLNNFAGALSTYEAAAREHPSSTTAASGLARTLADLNRPADAEALLHKHIANGRESPGIITTLATIHQFERNDPCLKLVRRAEGQRALKPVQLSRLQMALAKAYRDTGEHTRALELANRANKRSAKTAKYDRGATETIVANVKRQVVDDLAYPDQLESARPICLLGGSRSGKTLLESALAASVPDLFRGYENLFTYASVLQAVAGTTMSVLADTVVDSVSPAQLQEFRLRYLELCADSGVQQRPVTGTMPGDVFHLGYLIAAFPATRVVHCHRHTGDQMIDIFFKTYERGNDYSHRFEDILHYLHLYQDVMKYWHDKYPDRILDVHYENLVREPAIVLSEVADFCGLSINQPTSLPDLEEDWIGQWAYYEPQLIKMIGPDIIQRFRE